MNPHNICGDFFYLKNSMSAKEIWDYDKMKIDLIINYGYNLEVIWETELKSNNNKIITILNKYDTNNKLFTK